MSMKEGWTGRFYEDFEVGDIYQHSIGRTILKTDDFWFTNVTLNTNQIHFNEDYGSRTNYKQPLVNSCFTFNLVQGLTASDLSQNGRILKWENIRMPKPLFHGETVYAESKILEKNDDLDKDYGIIRAATRGVTETGKIVVEFFSTIEVKKNSV